MLILVLALDLSLPANQLVELVPHLTSVFILDDLNQASDSQLLGLRFPIDIAHERIQLGVQQRSRQERKHAEKVASLVVVDSQLSNRLCNSLIEVQTSDQIA